MTPGQPDVLEQVPVTGNPMKPTSGTYGDVATTDRLKQDLQLPPSSAGPPGVEGAPPPMPGMPQGAKMPGSAPGVVPDVLMRPTQMPDVPASTPLGGVQPQVESPQGRDARIAALKSLSVSPRVASATQQWAKEVLRMYGQ